MKASSATMAAFVAAVGEFPAALVLHNNTWRPYVDSWTATEVGPYSKADIKVKSPDVLARVVGNCEAQNALMWRGSEDAIFVALPVKEPAPGSDPDAPPVASDAGPAVAPVVDPTPPVTPKATGKKIK
jgi:hypothetical protein